MEGEKSRIAPLNVYLDIFKNININNIYLCSSFGGPDDICLMVRYQSCMFILSEVTQYIYWVFSKFKINTSFKELEYVIYRMIFETWFDHSLASLVCITDAEFTILFY